MPTEANKVFEISEENFNYDLDDLLEKITEENQHDLIFPEDGPKGDEVW
ncbi:MAG: hypothetical protein ABEJ24_01880 [Candidatus Magasanikbacteria bacterium]